MKRRGGGFAHVILQQSEPISSSDIWKRKSSFIGYGLSEFISKRTQTHWINLWINCTRDTSQPIVTGTRPNLSSPAHVPTYRLRHTCHVPTYRQRHTSQPIVSGTCATSSSVVPNRFQSCPPCVIGNIFEPPLIRFPPRLVEFIVYSCTNITFSLLIITRQ